MFPYLTGQIINVCRSQSMHERTIYPRILLNTVDMKSQFAYEFIGGNSASLVYKRVAIPILRSYPQVSLSNN